MAQGIRPVTPRVPYLMMNISMKGSQMPLTDAIKDYATKKLSSLEKIIHAPAYLHVEMGKPSRHHKGGPEEFVTEITLDANGHMYYIESFGGDLYASIDTAALELAESVKQGRGKRHTLVRKGRMMLKGLMRRGA